MIKDYSAFLINNNGFVEEKLMLNFEEISNFVLQNNMYSRIIICDKRGNVVFDLVGDKKYSGAAIISMDRERVSM